MLVTNPRSILNESPPFGQKWLESHEYSKCSPEKSYDSLKMMGMIGKILEC